MIRVTVWNEFKHEQWDENIRKIYPNGIHGAIAEFLKDEFEVRTATLGEPNCGLSQEILDNTDVLIWWGHMAHHEVPDDIARMVQENVLKGMGFIALHSAHHSKPFKYLMGTTCNLTWREDGDYERVWNIAPGHPITQGVGRYFTLEHEETYGEVFDIPEPDKLIFIGGYEGGEVFRSGCCFHRGNGNIFYFQPGHESFPTFYHKTVQTVIKNAVRWASPVNRASVLECPNVQKPELNF